MAGTVRVEVVAAEGLAWEGDALSVIARTTEGDVGILPHHEPFLAALVPCVAEILTQTGGREFVAVDGGFISVADNRVSILAGYAQLAAEIDGVTARKELESLEKLIESEAADEETLTRYQRLQVQVWASQRAQEQSR
ncbi:MAG: F0F1 ATP synthase subunit epsilon [Propionibacteriaceae bacterium]|nr:F0F1 ATP synthase subunit epsilon [Propionibacteriaceae bacterium]